MNSNTISEFKNRLENLKEIFEIDNKIEKIKKLDLLSSDENFWNDQEKAQKILKKQGELKSLVNSFKKLNDEFDDVVVMYDFFECKEISENEMINHISKFEKSIKDFEFKKMLSKKEDKMNAILNINPGAGGTESQDWAEMLRRMYMKWAQSKEFKNHIISEHKGDEAGLKSSTIKISGDYVFGWLKTESGIHRLVRISPFDSGARRHTSFASVWVYPVVDENIDVEILEKDLRIDTYRSSGAGGQHVNTTDSAVRITHLPTKIVVQCQNERSQHKNKETCMQMLKARLYNFELEKREKENENNQGAKKDIGWGHQIRSYVLQPYQLVKDLRNKTENTNPSSVLEGNIDMFIEEGIKNR